MSPKCYYFISNININILGSNIDRFLLLSVKFNVLSASNKNCFLIKAVII